MIEWGWVFENSDEVVARLSQHAQLTAIAVGLGLLISAPLAIYAYRHPGAYAPITGLAGALYTIPSLALFGFLVPYTGLSFTTAEIALVSYTLLILIRNIVAGLHGVPADAREAAVGMGYSIRQLLWRVEIPLALPVIFAGVRLATVTTIGLVTVSALLGQGGFGFFILRGLRDLDTNLSFWGAMLSIAFAVIVDRAFVGVERALTPWARARAKVA